MRTFLTFILAAALAPSGLAAEKKIEGSVMVPWEEFQALLEASKLQADKGKAPKDHALTAIELIAQPRDAALEVIGEFLIYVAESKWVKVPLLPASVPIGETARVDGMLVREDDVMYLATSEKGRHELELTFPLPIDKKAGGNVVSIPALQASTAVLSLTLPGTDLDVTVTPALSSTREIVKGQTVFRAVLPPGKPVELRWLATPRTRWAFHKAEYAVSVIDKKTADVQLTADLEVFTKDWLRIPIASTQAAVESVTLGGQDAVLDVGKTHVSIVTNAIGRHQLQARLFRSVDRVKGVPALDLFSVGGAITTLAVKLPEPNQEIRVEPGSKAQLTSAADGTTLVAQLPATSSVGIQWTEAVAEEERVRLYAESAHVIRVAQSVLEATSVIEYEVLRGEVAKLTARVPEDAAVRSVECPNIREWRRQGGSVVLYLTRPVKQKCMAMIRLERLVKAWPAEITSLRATPQGVERDRGVVAVEKNEDYELKPTVGAGITRVGAEALPGRAKPLLQGQAAYVFMYVKTPFELKVEADKAEEKAAEIYAHVDMLATVKEGNLRCKAKVALTIYKASVSELRLKLPGDVTVLNVSAASMRSYDITTEGDEQLLKIGLLTRVRKSYSCSVVYERMLGDEPTVPLPALQVDGAKIESGNVAVRSEANVEIKVASVEGARRVDVAELPAALLGSDSRGLLLAFNYPRRPFGVTLSFKQFQDVEVRPSIVDSANLTTVGTEDGIVITNAEYTIRNKERQFLRLTMPEDAEIWALTVSGRSATPARDKEGLVLVPLEKSRSEGQNLAPFRVQLMYRLQFPELGGHGKLSLTVPQADITTSQLFWSVYLPAKHTYFGFDGNVDWRTEGYRLVKASSYSLKAADVQEQPQQREAQTSSVAQQEVYEQAVRNVAVAAERQKALEKELFSQIQRGKAGALMPVTIALPTEGKLYRFKKIYPTEAPVPPHINIGYARGFWRVVGLHWW